MSAAADRIRLWREQPVVFVRECFGVEPDPWQCEVLEAFPHRQRQALLASKGVGKTALLAWLCWNFLATRPHPKVAATSVTADNLRDGLWTEMAFWQSKSPFLKSQFDWNKERITHKGSPSTWWMSARSWPKAADSSRQADTLAGLHADYLLFVLDEVGGIPDAVMAAAEAGLSTGKECHIVMAGNPTHLEGPLYRAATQERALWEVTSINADPDDPRRTPRVSIQWARDQITKYGADNPWVLVNVFGRFPPSSLNSLLGPDDVRDAMERKVAEGAYSHAARVLGVDVARQGDDRTVIFFRQGLFTLPAIKLRDPNGYQVAGRVALEHDNWDADAVFVDETGGYGAGVVDALRSMNRKPVGVQFAGSPLNPGFVNKRAEIWWQMAEWVKGGGSLPNDPELVAELTTPTYFFKGDKIQIEDKDQIKERLGRSPDCFVSGTEVLTPSGPQAIETLRVGDEVVTPWAVRRVVAVHWTVADSLTTVRFSNGKCLTGKGKHPVFTKDSGWVRLDALSMTNEIASDSRWERLKWLLASLWNTGGRSSGFSQAVAISSPAGRISLSACSIAASGSISRAPFLKACRFIIGTATGGTTPWRTWNSSLSEIISANTCWPGWLSPPIALAHSTPFSAHREPPRRGMPATRVANGTASTAPRHGSSARLFRLSAKSADLTTRPSSLLGPATARKRAPSAFAFGPTLTTLGRALTAVARSWQTAIERRAIVPVSVQTVIAQERVFNLTLDEDNAYYANGVLVRNCADALALTFAFPVAARTITKGEDRYSRGRQRSRASGWAA